MQASQPVRPFNNGEARTADIIGQARPLDILFPGQTITVHMKEGEPSRILVHQGKGRAGHILIRRNAEPGSDRLRQRCLADAEITVQEDNIAFAGNAADLLTEAGGRCRIL